MPSMGAGLSSAMNVVTADPKSLPKAPYRSYPRPRIRRCHNPAVYRHVTPVRAGLSENP